MKLTKLIIAAAIVASFGANAGSFDDAAHSVSVANQIHDHAVSNKQSALNSFNGSEKTMASAQHLEGAMKAEAAATRNMNTASSMASGTSMRDQISHQQAAAMAGVASANDAMTAAKGAVAQGQAAAAGVAAANDAMAAAKDAVAQGQAAAAGVAAANDAMAAAKASIAAPGKETNSSINVDSSTLGNKPVNVTKDGVTHTVAASSLPAGTQVSVPMDSAFSGPVHSGSDHDHSRSSSEHGTGNGGNNAANSNSAHGLGGGNHIGGGSAQSGSRNVGHW
ncbi:hypothetical protein ZL58_14470 [Salmonella enterica subsp. enterica serovar Typhimurium]|nr:hypothetical protein [Salmonella enterica subsp. enterica serovar Typhimurium]